MRLQRLGRPALRIAATVGAGLVLAPASAAAYLPLPAIIQSLLSALPSAPVTIPQPSTVTGAVVAEVLTATKVLAGPGTGKKVGTLSTTTTLGDEPEVPVVLAATTDSSGNPWVKVELPGRPNESVGWVSGNAVLIEQDPWYIAISIARRTVDVYDNGKRVIHARAVVGEAGTPTPTGHFSVLQIVPQTPPDGFLGPYTVQLNAYSDVLHHFGAGPGRVAIHGRGGASLLDPLGSARSHGCIRINNKYIEKIAAEVPLGTPVTIS